MRCKRIGERRREWIQFIFGSHARSKENSIFFLSFPNTEKRKFDE